MNNINDKNIKFKSGFIGLIGRTNVGKSTLINKILEKNVVITSDKAQTTRSRINCIYNTKNAQAIFVDCPGFFKPRNLLGKKLNDIIYNVLSDIDIITVIVDIADGIGKGDYFVFEQVRNKNQYKILLLNKIDLLNKTRLRELPQNIEDLKNNFIFFNEIIPVSAKKGTNISIYLDSIIKNLPEGPKYYPEDMITDMPLKQIITEVIREKLLNFLYEELPHSINVELENLIKTQTSDGFPLTKIECSIYVEKKSQKAIIIGQSGSMLKKVGELARIELERILETKVYLQLWVKVAENWTKNEQFISRLGYS